MYGGLPRPPLLTFVLDRVGRTLPSASSELALSLSKGQALSDALDLDLEVDFVFVTAPNQSRTKANAVESLA
jgi:hypothetical protein